MSYAFIAKNGLWLIFGRTLSLILSFIAVVTVARIYGPELFGTLSLAISIIALISPILQLGLNSIVTRDLVNEPEKTHTIMGTVLLLRIFGAVTCIIFSSILLLVDFQTENNLLFYITIFLLGELFKSGIAFSFWLESKTKGKIITLCSVSAIFISSILKIVLALLGADFIYIIYLQAIEGLLIGGGYFIAYLILADSPLKFDVSVSRVSGYLKKCLPLIASSVTAAIYMKIDQVMIANFMDHTSVGIYAVASRISEVWYFVPIMIATAAFPTLLKARKEGGGRYERYLQDIFDYLCIIGYIAVVGVTLFGASLVSMAFGNEYLAAAPILLIHIWGGVFMSMRALASKWILAEDVLIFSLVTQGAGAITNVSLNYFLIPSYGLTGAAIATLLSYAMAGYFSFALSSKTHTIFRMMSLAFLSPIRKVKEII